MANTGDGCTPLNRHAQLRRELWNKVFTDVLASSRWRHLIAEAAANRAVAAFDKRFKH